MKIAGVIISLVAVGCGLFVGRNLNTGEESDIAVFAEEIITYDMIEDVVPTVQNTSEVYFVAEIFYEEETYDGEFFEDGIGAAIEDEIENEIEAEIEETEEIYEGEIFDLPDRSVFVPSNTYKVALTFDDGPGYFTNYLLDILDEHGGRVTFCVIGDMLEDGAVTVVRAFEAGHEIVGHSWDHSNMARFSSDDIAEQILKTSALITEIIGEPPPSLFRVPFGLNNQRITQAAHETGYGLLNWSIDPQDWRYRCEDHLYEYIMENVRHGAIIVLHDVHEETVYAMALIIPSLMEAGFELVTASEIINYVYGGIQPGFEFTGTR